MVPPSKRPLQEPPHVQPGRQSRLGTHHEAVVPENAKAALPVGGCGEVVLSRFRALGCSGFKQASR